MYHYVTYYSNPSCMYNVIIYLNTINLKQVIFKIIIHFCIRLFVTKLAWLHCQQGTFDRCVAVNKFLRNYT